jgi:hypothetical protein
MSAKTKQILFLALTLIFLSVSNIFAQGEAESANIITVKSCGKANNSCEGSRKFDMENDKGDKATCEIRIKGQKSEKIVEQRLDKGEKERKDSFNKRKPGETIKDCELIKDQQEEEAKAAEAASDKPKQDSVASIEAAKPDEDKKDDEKIKEEKKEEKIIVENTEKTDSAEKPDFTEKIVLAVFFLVVLLASIYIFTLKSSVKDKENKLQMFDDMERRLNRKIKELEEKNKELTENTINLKEYDDMTPEKILNQLREKSERELIDAIGKLLLKELLSFSNKEELVYACAMLLNPDKMRELVDFLKEKSKSASSLNHEETPPPPPPPKPKEKLYFPMPSGDSFNAANASTEFEEGISLYRFERDADSNEALIYVESRQSVVQRITSSPRTQDGVIEDEDGSYYENANEIETKSPGEAFLSGGKWNVTKKAKIRYC